MGGREGRATSRFLTLFNEHKARHVKLKGGADRSRRNGGATAAPASAGASDGRRVAGREAEDLRRSKGALLPDCEDEHDYANYDDDMVDRLASGARVGGKKRKAVPSRDEFSQGAAPGGGGGSGFVNPHTGATEFTNPREMFSSSSDED